MRFNPRLFCNHFFLCCLFLPLFHSSLASGDSIPFRVKLSLTAGDAIRSEMTSNMNRELRLLGDVELVDDEKTTPDWIIEIVAIETKLQSGQATGVAVSVVILKPFDNKQLVPLTKKELKPATALGAAIGVDPFDIDQFLIKDPVAHVQFLTDGLERIDDHRLLMDSRNNVNDLCRSIVADFDVRHLESSRKIQRMVEQGLKRRIRP